MHYHRRSYTKEGIPFPPDTKAFLYYSIPSGKPRIAGELRLRVASSDDHASFESGSDLLGKDGHPWTRPLYYIPQVYSPLYEKLREENFVSDDLDRVLSPFLTVHPSNYHRPHLYTLNDPFIVDFNITRLSLFIITEQGMQILPFQGVFYESRNDFIHRRPYTGAYISRHSYIDPHESVLLGSALARFERSTLPEHKDARTVVLRFLKIITPVKCVIPSYDDYICPPKEGELYRRSKSARKLDQSVWSVNIDQTKGSLIRGLQLLWDA